MNDDAERPDSEDDPTDGEINVPAEGNAQDPGDISPTEDKDEGEVHPVSPADWAKGLKLPFVPDIPSPIKDLTNRLNEQISSMRTDWLKSIPGLRAQYPPELTALSSQIAKFRVPRFEQTWPRVNFSYTAPRVVLPDIGPKFAEIIRALRETRPPNWPDSVDIDRMTEVIQTDGLPMVWVPPTEVVTEVLRQTDRASRVQVLLAHQDDIMDHCRMVLGDVSDPSMNGQLPLAFKAIDAFQSNHTEAAQTLAVVVAETVISREIGDYEAAKRRSKDFDVDRLSYADVRIEGALAPIGVFYTSWHPRSPRPAPAELSRHVTVHNADVNHYTRGNSLIAVMLMASALRAIQDLKNRNP